MISVTLCTCISLCICISFLPILHIHVHVHVHEIVLYVHVHVHALYIHNLSLEKDKASKHNSNPRSQRIMNWELILYKGDRIIPPKWHAVYIHHVSLRHITHAYMYYVHVYGCFTLHILLCTAPSLCTCCAYTEYE